MLFYGLLQERKGEIMKERILFVMDQGVGNMVLASPALRAIRIAKPDAELWVFGGDPAIHVLDDADFIDGIIQKWEEGDLYDWLLISIWGQAFCKDYNDDFQSKNAKQIIQARIVNPDAHEMLYHMELAFKVGYEGDPPEAYVPYCEFDIKERFGLKDRIKLPDGESVPAYVVLADTAVSEQWRFKRWTHYAELASLVLSTGVDVIMTGGKKEKEEWDLNRDAYPEGVITAYDLTIAETCHLLKNADYVVGNDSGPVHLASVTGVNTFALFGPTRHTKNQPLGNNTHIIRRDMACSPCQYTDWQVRCQQNECLTDLTAQEVSSHITQALFEKKQIGKQLLSIDFPDRKETFVTAMRLKDNMDYLPEIIPKIEELSDRIVIVDNGSTDGGREFLAERAKETGKYTIEYTEGLDEARDRDVMDRLIKDSGCTWAFFCDGDEMPEDRLDREQIEKFMNQKDANTILFRHVHFWGNLTQYRIDQRWKPKHARMIWRVTPESTVKTESHVHPEIAREVKGATIATNFVIKHWGHSKKEHTLDRQALYRDIDNEDTKNWSGRTYDHMDIEGPYIELAEWTEDDHPDKRDYGKPSVLILLCHGMGDCLMATPAIHKLKQQNSDLMISVMGLEETEERDFKTHEIFDDNPALWNYFSSKIDHHPTWWDRPNYESRTEPQFQKRLAELTNATQFDQVVIISLQGNWGKHRIDKIADTMNVKLQTPDDYQMRLYPGQKDRLWATKIYMGMLGSPIDKDAGKKIVSVHRFCGHKPKNWDLDECEILIDWLIAKGYHVLYWDNDDRHLETDPRAIKSREGLGKASDFANDLTVLRGAALMELCAFHVGADSFPMHVASAMKIPTIGFFERTFPHETAPIGEIHHYIVSESVYKNCAPAWIEKNQARVILADRDKVKAHHVQAAIKAIWHDDKAFDLQTVKRELGILDDLPLTFFEGENVYNLAGYPVDHNERQMFRQLKSLLNGDKVKGLLEIGVGDGYYLGNAAQLGHPTLGFEPFPESHKIALENITQPDPLSRGFPLARLCGVAIGLPDTPEAPPRDLPDLQATKPAFINTVPHNASGAWVSMSESLLSRPIRMMSLDQVSDYFDIVKIDAPMMEDIILQNGLEYLDAKDDEDNFYVKVVFVRKYGEGDADDILKHLGFKVGGIGRNWSMAVRDPVQLPTHNLCGFYDAAEFIEIKEDVPEISDLLELIPDAHSNRVAWFELVRLLELMQAPSLSTASVLGDPNDSPLCSVFLYGGETTIIPYYLAKIGHSVTLVSPNKPPDLPAEFKEMCDGSIEFFTGSFFDWRKTDTEPYTVIAYDFAFCFNHLQGEANDIGIVEEMAEICPMGVIGISLPCVKEIEIDEEAADDLDSDEPEIQQAGGRLYDRSTLEDRIINPLHEKGFDLLSDVDWDLANPDDSYYQPTGNGKARIRLFFAK